VLDMLLGPSTSLTPDGPVGTGRLAHGKYGHKHNRVFIEDAQRRQYNRKIRGLDLSSLNVSAQSLDSLFKALSILRFSARDLKYKIITNMPPIAVNP